MESRYLDRTNPSKKRGKQYAAFVCSNAFYGPNSLPTRFHFQVSEGFEQRRRWCNLIKRQHGKDGISTVVSSEYFRKVDTRKTVIGRWELATSSELSPPSSPPPPKKKKIKKEVGFLYL